MNFGRWEGEDDFFYAKLQVGSVCCCWLKQSKTNMMCVALKRVYASEKAGEETIC